MPPGGNPLETLTAALQESLKETSEARKYHLGVLQDLNTQAEALAASSKRLADTSAALAREEKDTGTETGKRGTTRSSDPSPLRPVTRP